IQGCDLWLNTPRRPLEASGTSGMKAALNGCIHCSISDGWWDEAYAPERGFLIPHVSDPISHEEQDIIESRSLYDTLIHQVLPTYFSRHSHEDWSNLMKNSIQLLGRLCSSQRMVREYAEKYYVPGCV
ncbi:MAG: Maltodextrin phosphorylase, partial [Bacteroidota bacterium]